MKKILLAVFTVFTLQIQAQNIAKVPQKAVQCWKQIEFGGGHIIGIKNDGTLWTCGANTAGQLGDGTTINKSVPLQVGTDNDWEAVSANHQTNLALKTDGTIWAWGDNFYGQITGGSNPQTTPIQIGTDTDWKTISCGGNHMLAIKDNGTLWVWGGNSFGALGLGNTTTVLSPTQLGVANDWAVISTGSSTSYAIKTDGTLWVCGNNQSGEMGNGTGVGNNAGGPSVLVPTQIGGNDWKDVDAGGQHVIAQKNDNTLWSWGINGFGELGDNTMVTRSFPMQIGTDAWTSFSAGNGSCAGTKADGKLYAWGINYQGIGIKEPTLVNDDTDWDKTLSSGQTYYLAVKTNGNMYAWGGNDVGQLGLGDTVVHPQPTFFDNMCVETAGLNDNALSQITLYPNPTYNTLTLENAENLILENLSVTDMTGKLALSQKGNDHWINVEALPAGIYFLNVSAQEGVQHLKFVKE
ncbi:T9SS type A sorting domain-containing protein [Flavobacterium sp. AG291]|uniref:RCC1 domain-containing protein n=1 Tax=Flavobacterium sp. AG291 TaxID=2184000 RepID=UPI000E0A7371|nr:T9SS type A sorting domain-containing protein [Flavobacterium sp. AG291]RDI11936.1 putative secreted protein (Por secretion system target) [Flavobacterium sp. AG291]